MRTLFLRFRAPRVVPGILLAVSVGMLVVPVTSQGAVSTFSAILNGASESPPNASTGIGTAIVEIDPVAHTMRVYIDFSGLVSPTTVAHIHGPTASPLTGTASPMSPTPSFPGFPSGVQAATYDQTFDMTQASSYNAAFLNNTTNLGSTATAEATFFQAIADGKAYVNVHTSLYTGGEIRGFLTAPLPTRPSTWGGIKALYR